MNPTCYSYCWHVTALRDRRTKKHTSLMPESRAAFAIERCKLCVSLICRIVTSRMWHGKLLHLLHLCRSELVCW